MWYSINIIMIIIIIHVSYSIGYLGNEQTAVIIISVCYLPPKSLHNYPQMISQTFL